MSVFQRNSAGQKKPALFQPVKNQGQIRQETKNLAAPAGFAVRLQGLFAGLGNSGEMDASIVCTHMMLEAEDLGLGSVWVLLFDLRKIRQAFQLPENIIPHCLLPVGYASENAAPYRPWHDSFREMSDIAKII